MTDNYIGIDYGNGKTNIDEKTGIRFGVISQNEVLQVWADDSEADYGKPTCPHCGSENHSDGDVTEYRCDDCKVCFDSEQAYGDDPIRWTIDGEYRAEQGGDDTDIFVLESPYYTRAQFCSPCAPGACHLENPIPNGEKTYCFGHDWFDGGSAPYPVYRVSDDSIVD